MRRRKALQGAIDALWGTKAETTKKAYMEALGSFAKWMNTSPAQARDRLLQNGRHEAQRLVGRWRSHGIERGLSASTINQRLSAVSLIVRIHRMAGKVDWALDVPRVPARGVRDTTGPGVAGFSAMLGTINGSTTPKGCRDRAILRLLFDCALRRAEVTELDMGHLDLEAGTVSVLGKGRRERETLTLPEPTKAALASWLAVRGEDPGPLFLSLDRARKGDGRITGRSVHRVVQALGKAAGIGAVRPHGLRHTAVTACLDAGAGLLSARAFSRLLTCDGVMVYDDRKDERAKGAPRWPPGGGA